VAAARASAAAAQEGVTQARARLAQAQAQLEYARTAPQQVSVQRARGMSRALLRMAGSGGSES